MAELTEDERDLIAHAARRIVGAEQWDSMSGGIAAKLRQTLDTTRQAGPHGDVWSRKIYQTTVWRLVGLLRLADGERFDLCRLPGLTGGESWVVRQATVRETVEDMFRCPHTGGGSGWEIRR